MLKDSFNPSHGEYMLLQKKVDMMERMLLEWELQSKIQIEKVYEKGQESGLRQELQETRQKWDQERMTLTQMLSQKNSEIQRFKDELEYMMDEMRQLRMN